MTNQNVKMEKEEKLKNIKENLLFLFKKPKYPCTSNLYFGHRNIPKGWS